MRRGVARHPARRGVRVAGVRGVLAALREVPAEAGLEEGAARGALGLGAAESGVKRGDEREHVGGKLVERDLIERDLICLASRDLVFGVRSEVFNGIIPYQRVIPSAILCPRRARALLYLQSALNQHPFTD